MLIASPRISPNRGMALGPILFIIAVIAIIAAALAGTNKSMTGPTQEQAKTNAYVMMDYIQNLRTGVQRVMLENGCEDYQVSFDTTGGIPAFHNPYAPSDGHCNVYAANGGQVVPLTRLPNAIWSNNTQGSVGIVILEVPQVGTGQPMLGVNIGSPIDNSTCLAFNTAEGVATYPGYQLPPLLDGMAVGPMYDTYTGNGDLDLYTNATSNNGPVTLFNNSSFNGHMQFCGANTDRVGNELGWENIYAVLLVR